MLKPSLISKGYRLQPATSSARPDVSIEWSQGFQTVRYLISC